jgi:hypothetical protein
MLAEGRSNGSGSDGEEADRGFLWEILGDDLGMDQRGGIPCQETLWNMGE